MSDSHELMVMWLDLQKAVKGEAVATGQRYSDIKPWASDREDVRTAWLRLCQSENLEALKEWLDTARQSGLPTEWAEEAVRCSQDEL